MVTLYVFDFACWLLFLKIMPELFVGSGCLEFV